MQLRFYPGRAVGVALAQVQHDGVLRSLDIVKELATQQPKRHRLRIAAVGDFVEIATDGQKKQKADHQIQAHRMYIALPPPFDKLVGKKARTKQKRYEAAIKLGIVGKNIAEKLLQHFPNTLQVLALLATMRAKCFLCLKGMPAILAIRNDRGSGSWHR